MKKSPSVVRLQLQASLCLSSFIVVTHMLAALAPFFSNISIIAKLLLLLPIMLSGYVLWCNLIVHSRELSIREANWLADDSWQIVNRDGRVWRVQSWKLLLCTPALVMLIFKVHKKRSSVLVLCTDSIETEVNRQLRVRLNTG